MGRTIRGRIIGCVLLGAWMAFGLMGCQGMESDPVETTGQTEEGIHEPITILTARQNYGAFAELLAERYPEVNLEFISFYGGDSSGYMRESLQHGDIPDIYTVTYQPDGALQKEELLDLSAYGVVNAYASTTLDSLNVDGGIYLLPSRYSLVGIVYNKTLMEENGWKVPESFEELQALSPEIEAAGYEVANMGSHLTGTTFGTFFAVGNTTYFSTPEGAQWKKDFLEGNAQAVGSLKPVTDYFQEWIDAGYVNTYYYDHQTEGANADFDQRKYVFQLYSNRLSSEDTTDEYGFMPFLSKDGSNNMLVRLVSRYYGLNRDLGAAGNEQKLEDALKVLELMGTQEGQEALAEGNNSFIPSTSINVLPEGSPYQDVLDLINSGSMVDMVYSGWENHIVPLIEDYGNEWIRGNIDSKTFLEGMDELNRELLAGQGEEPIGTLPEDLSLSDTAILCAAAEGKAVDADAALIALPDFHGFSGSVNLENNRGVHAGIYAGDVTRTSVSIFSPNGGTILTIEMTGAEIKALAEAGYYVGEDPTPFDYCLVTKGGLTLEDDVTYTLAIGSLELSDEALLERATDTTVDQRQAVIDYITELGTITKESIVWE